MKIDESLGKSGVKVGTFFSNNIVDGRARGEPTPKKHS